MADNIFSAFLTSGFPIAIWLCGNVRVPGTKAGAAGTDGARAYWCWLTSGGRQAKSQCLTLDRLFSWLYGGALAASLCWVWMALDQPFHPGWIFAPLVIIMIADWLENLVQAAQLRHYTSPNEQYAKSLWIQLASCSTIMKLWLTSGLYISLAGLILNMLCTFTERRLATDAVE